MRSSQYFVISLFFLILQRYIRWILPDVFNPILSLPYTYIQSAIGSIIFLLCVPLCILFAILGGLVYYHENKKKEKIESKHETKKIGNLAVALFRKYTGGIINKEELFENFNKMYEEGMIDKTALVKMKNYINKSNKSKKLSGDLTNKYIDGIINKEELFENFNKNYEEGMIDKAGLVYMKNHINKLEKRLKE